MWDELYVQQDINDAFKGGSKVENNSEQNVSDPHHGTCNYRLKVKLFEPVKDLKSGKST